MLFAVLGILVYCFATIPIGGNLWEGFGIAYEAIFISSVIFGIGHIINVLAGQANMKTVIQVFFAITWGFIFS